jgi:hypothetical protein
VPSTSPAAAAASLGLDASAGQDFKTLRSAIRRELFDLRQYEPDLSLAQETRQRELTEAAHNLPRDEVTSTELVPVPSELVDALVRLVDNSKIDPAGPVREAAATDKLQASKASTRIVATKDFRNARTVPFAALSGAVAAVWGLRESLGITDILILTPAGYLAGAVGAICIIGSGYFVVRKGQQSDERTLDLLYDTDVQEEALRVLSEGDFPVFRAWDFTFALARAARRLSLRAHPASTVDLQRAARDAALLGLDRFVEAGILDRVRAGGFATAYRFSSGEGPLEAHTI